MAEYNFAETVEGDVFRAEPTDVMTGDRNRNRFLYYQLKMSILSAEKIDIIVSFLMESGVRIILDDLRSALDRGAQIRMLTGNYLGVTQPSALYLLKKELGERLDLRFYHDKARSFHPKSYIFHYGDHSEIYIGSSNISKSALTSGIEWNYRFSSLADGENFLLLFQPRGAQIEALYALEESRAEGAVKGLVQAATGVGKTYLAAFDSAKYERVLFVAHREKI